MTTPTLEDALHAARLLRDTRPTVGSKIVLDFLELLAKIAEPEGVISSDEEGYVIEGAYQKGFEHIDDAAVLLVVHSNDLIKYVLEQRRYAAEYALKQATCPTCGDSKVDPGGLPACRDCGAS